MLVFHVCPVHAVRPLLVVAQKTLLEVDFVGDVRVVDLHAEGAVSALHVCEDVAEQKFRDEATRPSFLGGRHSRGEGGRKAWNWPLNQVLDQVLVFLNRAALIDSAVILAAQLPKRKLLERAVVLVEVV